MMLMFLVCVDIEVDLALDVVVDVDEVGFYGMGSFVHDVPSQPPSPPPLLKSSGQWDAESRGHYPSFAFVVLLGFLFFGMAFLCHLRLSVLKEKSPKVFMKPKL